MYRIDCVGNKNMLSTKFHIKWITYTLHFIKKGTTKVIDSEKNSIFVILAIDKLTNVE